MPSATEAPNLVELLKDVPRGAWVAIGPDYERVIAFGSNLRDVLEEAHRQGHDHPLVVRVPESNVALML
jgi:hypothetical protein